MAYYLGHWHTDNTVVIPGHYPVDLFSGDLHDFCRLPLCHATPDGWCRHGDGRSICMASGFSPVRGTNGDIAYHTCDGSGVVTPYKKSSEV